MSQNHGIRLPQISCCSVETISWSLYNYRSLKLKIGHLLCILVGGSSREVTSNEVGEISFVDWIWWHFELWDCITMSISYCILKHCTRYSLRFLLWPWGGQWLLRRLKVSNSRITLKPFLTTLRPFLRPLISSAPPSPGNQGLNNFTCMYWNVGEFPSPCVLVDVLQIELSYWN